MNLIKLLAAIIITIIIFVIIGFIGNFLVKVDSNKSQKTAYKIDIPETSVDSASQTVSNDNIEAISSLSS